MCTSKISHTSTSIQDHYSTFSCMVSNFGGQYVYFSWPISPFSQFPSSLKPIFHVAPPSYIKQLLITVPNNLILHQVFIHSHTRHHRCFATTRYELISNYEIISNFISVHKAAEKFFSKTSSLITNSHFILKTLLIVPPEKPFSAKWFLNIQYTSRFFWTSFIRFPSAFYQHP